MRILILIILVFQTASGYSQSLTYLYEQASKARENGDLSMAAGFYQVILEKNDRSWQARYELAEICRQTRLLDEALRHYKILIRENPDNYPMARFWYAILLKEQGDYEKAASSFRNFYRNYRLIADFKPFVLRAKHEAELCSRLADGFSPGLCQSNVNQLRITKGSSEFNPVVLSDSMLLFSLIMIDSLNAGRPVFVLLSQSPNQGSGIDTLLKDSQYQYSFSGNALGDYLFFSRCPIGPSKEKCGLFSGRLSESGLTDILAVIDSAESLSADYRHPAFAVLKGKPHLFYASDRDGGFGGFDLYMAELSHRKIIRSKNLGSSVNSPADELTPFFYPADSSLFFSSEWHENYGGFDIFRSYYNDNRFTSAINLGKEINSSYDDLSLHLNFYDQRAFFTSNRPVSENSEVCCTNLYSFQSDYALPDSILIARKEREIRLAIEEVRQRLINLDPFDVYFDNDEPNPRSTDSITLIAYDELFEKYLLRKGVYLSQISENMKGADRKQALENLDLFFDDQVGAGMNQLETLVKDVAYLIESGKRIEIEVESYASPLNTGDYNLILSKRRISSLMNYLQKAYPDSLNLVLQSGKLSIIHRAMGDSLSVGKVSADLKDAVNSIYRVEAAKERRISILRVSVF